MSDEPVIDSPDARPDQRGHSRAAAARRGGLSAHGDSAVRRAGEVHRRARSGHEGGQAHPAGRPETGGRRRSEGRRSVPGRHGRDHPAAAEASRRHRQGAGRGRGPRQHREADGRGVLLRRSDADAGSRALRRARNGRAHALGDHAVRAIRQTEQEGASRDPDLARGHRAGRAAWRTPSPRTCR